MIDFMQVVGVFLCVVSMAVLAYPVVVVQEMLDVIDEICSIEFGGY